MKVFYYRHNVAGEKPHEIAREKIAFNELTFVLKGELTYFVNDLPVTIKENGSIFLKSGSVRERNFHAFGDYVSFNFLSPVDFNMPLTVDDVMSGEIKMLLAVCDGIVFKHYEWTDKISTALKLILSLIHDKLLTREENPVVVKVKNHIKVNLNGKLTLSDISSHVGYSPNYLDSLFRLHAGKSVTNYLIEERISKAKLLLQEGILSLKEIADSVGFEDYNYFSRTFKKRTGYTPTRYRASLKF